jgi:hypothetical protein
VRGSQVDSGGVLGACPPWRAIKKLNDEGDYDDEAHQ